MGVPEDTDTLIERFASEPGVEGEQLDFKAKEAVERPTGRQKLVKILTAIANSGGGTVIIGVYLDEGKLIIDNFDPENEIKRDLSHIAQSNTRPAITDFWEMHFNRYSGKTVLRIDVEGAKSSLIEFKEDDGFRLYHRVGDTTPKMEHTDIKHFYDNRNSVLIEKLSGDLELPWEMGERAIKERNVEDKTKINQKSANRSIKFASLLPLTGALSAYGQGMQEAVNLAAEDINQAGGILNRQILLINVDSETDPSSTVQRYINTIRKSDVVGFVGPASDGCSVPLAEYSAQDRIMQVSNASTTPSLADSGYNSGLKYVARTSPNDAQQGLATGHVMNAHMDAQSAAFLFVDNPYGKQLARVASDTFNGETVGWESYEKDKADYEDTLKKLFINDPEVVGFIGYPESAQIILGQWANTNYGCKWVFTEGVNSPDFFRNLSPILQGSYVVSPTPRNTEGVTQFKRKIGEQNTLFAAHAYDALFLQALAIQKAGEVSGKAIANNIRLVSRPPGEVVTVGEFGKAKRLLRQGKRVNYEGASSKVDLTKRLEPLHRHSVYRLDENGQKEVIETLSSETFEKHL